MGDWQGLVVVAALVVGPAAVAAEGVARPVSDAEAAQWNAVASVEVGGRRSCSAVLISDHEAVTAAHCVYDRLTGHKTDPAAFRLLFGQRDGAPAAVRGVKATAFLPGYAGQSGMDAVAQDLGLLVLDAPVSPDDVTPMAVAGWPDPMGSFVDIVGYERGGPNTATLREGCTAIEAQDGVVAVTCAVVSGLSGAPVVLSRDPALPPQLVAAVSSRSTGAGQSLALVVAIAPRLAELRGLIGK